MALNFKPGKVAMAALTAITINTILLKIAPLFHIVVAKGGVLKLLLLYTEDSFSPAVLQFFHSIFFWIIFHYFLGLAMCFLYAYILAPLFKGSLFLKGTLFSLIPWLLNGLFVSPMLGQSIFAFRELSVLGLIYFFMANWVYALLFVYGLEKTNQTD